MARSDNSLTPKQAEELRQKLVGMAKANRETCMDVCWACYESNVAMTRDGNGELVYCWQTWGHDTWESYVGKELDLHLTTAYSFAKIWEVFMVQLEGAWDRELLLGITKMRLLSSANLTKKNVNSWLRRAATMTCRELRAAVYETDELHSFAASLTAPQMKQVLNALEVAKAAFPHGEKMSRGDLLARVMKDWRSTQGLVATKKSKAA